MATREARPYEHAKKARKSIKHSHLFHWIRSLQSEGREPAVLILEELQEDTSRKFLGLVERMYIDSLRRIGHRLTNVAEGGLGGIATYHTPEFRASQRVRMLGRIVSVEERLATGARNKGNPSKLGQKDSPETRARKSAALKGKVFPHQREKWSLAKKLRFAETRARNLEERARAEDTNSSCIPPSSDSEQEV